MTAIRKHRPSAMMTSISSVISLRVLRRNSGIRKIPTTNHRIRINPNRSVLIRISCPTPPPSAGLADVPAMVDSITIITMASTSSKISTLITSEANRCCRSPMSSKALYIMVVDDMASIPPRKMQFICDHPKALPTSVPSNIIENTMLHAAMAGAIPIFRIFLNEKSSPSANKRNKTPMSAQVWMFSLSTTDAK